MKLAGPGEEDWNSYSGSEQINDITENLTERFSLLTRTRDSVQNPLEEPGQLLTSNLTKQIERRKSQLESFQNPSRDSSKVRFSSTPHNCTSEVHAKFGDIDSISDPVRESNLQESSNPPLSLY